MMKMVDTLMVLLFPFLDCIPFTLSTVLAVS